MSSRLHDRSHFFKYASLETALRVIESKSFRWSSPNKFNDPFDHQSGFALDSKPDEFAKLLAASIDRIIFSDAVPPVNSVSLFAKKILQLRSDRDRLHRERFLQWKHEACTGCAARLHKNIDKLNADLYEHFCSSRVFCVSELHDNVVMWSHYADGHRGVVFMLRCIDEIDNLLLVARKVSYTSEFVVFPSADEYAKHLTGEQIIDFVPLYWNIAYTKHNDWSYEKEWRVHVDLLRERPGEGHTSYRDDPRVFEAVYLGCQMQDGEVASIAELIRRHLPATKIFRGKKSTTGFALLFTEI